MDLQLGGKVVAITGGTTGIGKACALEYLKEGCSVAVCSRNKKKLEHFRASCAASGYDKVFCLEADVSVPASLESFIDATVAYYSRLDIWYNNAGMGIRKPLMELSLEEWDAVMHLNLRAVFVGSRYAARKMAKTGGGVIVNASSFDMRPPLAGNGPYTTSKWGVEALTRIMAAEFAPMGIRVFSFAPSMIETDLTRERIEARRGFYAKQTVLNRVGMPEDIAPMLVMLTSDAASYFTGTTVEISGGKYCVQNPQYAWELIKPQT